jgi:hypothetical protein
MWCRMWHFPEHSMRLSHLILSLCIAITLGCANQTEHGIKASPGADGEGGAPGVGCQVVSLRVGERVRDERSHRVSFFGHSHGH